MPSYHDRPSTRTDASNTNRPAADALLARLADRTDSEPAPFPNRNGTCFPVRRIALLVNRCLRAVQELLVHAWVTTRQRYTHLEMEGLHAQVADLPASRRGCVG